MEQSLLSKAKSELRNVDSMEIVLNYIGGALYLLKIASL